MEQNLTLMCPCFIQALLSEEENLLIINRLHQVLRPFVLRRLKHKVWCLIDKLHLMSLFKNATCCAFVLVPVITINLVLLLSYSWDGILEYLVSCDTVNNMLDQNLV